MIKKSPKTSEAMLRSIADYDKKTRHGVYLKLNIKTDADIIEWLNSKENRQGYIKSLIRDDMRREKENGWE